MKSRFATFDTRGADVLTRRPSSSHPPKITTDAAHVLVDAVASQAARNLEVNFTMRFDFHAGKPTRWFQFEGDSAINEASRRSPARQRRL